MIGVKFWNQYVNKVICAEYMIFYNYSDNEMNFLSQKPHC